jgi:hypothetical protein
MYTWYCSIGSINQSLKGNKPMNNTTLTLTNNEQISKGVYPQADGTFLAMTYTRSKSFKTRKGAEKWLAR